MRNARRRQALLDAAIEVLADLGARGLTFRAVDTRAEVPAGTTSNYFTSRDELLTAAGGRIYQRLAPDPGTLAAGLAGPRDRQRVLELVHAVTERVGAYRTGHLALLELRLEATRRPALREVLTATVRTDLEATIGYHLGTALPGDAATAVVLHLAINWLILEQLTLPEVLHGLPGLDGDDGVVAAVVERILDATSEAPPGTAPARA